MWPSCYEFPLQRLPGADRHRGQPLRTRRASRRSAHPRYRRITSLIRTTILQAVGFDPDASPDRIKVAMGNGVVLASRIVLNRLSALGRHRLAFPVIANSLPAATGIDGLIGLDFLRGEIVTVDFLGGQVSLA